MRGIESNLDRIEEAGIRPIAISVDTPEVTRGLCRDEGYTYTFLSDQQAQVIRRYDLLHEGQGAEGQPIARPGEFLLDASGTVRWVNLTENYWVRADPDDFIRAAKELP